MKKIVIYLFLLEFVLCFSLWGDNFDNYFTGEALKFDFVLAADSGKAKVYFKSLNGLDKWAGPRKNMVPDYNYGTYRVVMRDKESKDIIFLQGFSPLFQEWLSTPEAKKVSRMFEQSILLPKPNKKAILSVECRSYDTGKLNEIFSYELDPQSYFIRKEKPLDCDTFELLNNGDSSNHVDLVIVSEAYSKDEKEKFVKDAKRIMKYLFSSKAFGSRKSDFNIRAVFVPSIDSNPDIPGKRVYKNTVFDSSFYTFDTPRYLTCPSIHKLYTYASYVPCDTVFLLINSKTYGGGGFYNFYSACTSDNELTPVVSVHEFGHGFGGLADEYYTSSVAYEDFYNLKVEPWEPNITTLVDFKSKWKDMVKKKTPIPTDRIKKHKDTIGVFEGGGYMAKGVYSPTQDCRMKTNKAKDFCPVCTKSILKVIDYWCEKE